MLDKEMTGGDAPHLRIKTPHARRKRRLAMFGIALLIPLAIAGLVLPAVDWVQEAGERST